MPPDYVAATVTSHRLLLACLLALLAVPVSAVAQEEFPEQPRTAPRTD